MLRIRRANDARKVECSDRLTLGSVWRVHDDDGDRDLDGWSRDELVSIARWHLMHGFDLSAVDDAGAWEIVYDRGTVACEGHQPVDPAQIAEGRRLLARAYPDRPITLRRRVLIEHDRVRRA